MDGARAGGDDQNSPLVLPKQAFFRHTRGFAQRVRLEAGNRGQFGRLGQNLQ